MTPKSLLENFRADAARLMAAAEGSLDAPVPSCPGWAVRDLAEHVAMVYLHKVEAIRTQKLPDPWPPAFGEGDPLELLAGAYTAVLAEFEAHDPADPAWTWTDDRTVGFWVRRMAQETAVHRVDAELAIGERTPIDPELAVDGVDELLSVILPAVQQNWPDAITSVLADAAGEVVEVRAGGREWRLRLGQAGAEFGVPGPADATVDGDPESVLLWLWGRSPDSSVTMTGSPSVLRLARKVLAEASQ
jgi:uncharacterized protein (TIGR03083 family)